MAYNPYGNQSNYQDQNNWATTGPTGGYRGVSGAQTDAGLGPTGGYRGAPTNGYASVDQTTLPRNQNNASPYAMNNSMTQPGQGGWQSSPNYGASMPTQQQQSQNWGQQPANSDFRNSDGSWHYNPQYGQDNRSGGGGAQPNYGAGPMGPNPWGGGGRQSAWGPYPAGGNSGGGGGPQIGGYNPGAAANYYNFLPVDYLSQEANKAALKNTSQYQIPIMQFGQNAYQYQNDFDEQRRRFDMQYGQTGQQNQFNQNLATQQQQLAEYQAYQGAGQWQSQFDQQKANDAWNQNFQQTGQSQQYNLQSAAQQQQQNQFLANLQNSQNQFQQNYSLQQQAQNASQDQWTKQFGLQSQQANQQYGLQTRAADLAALQNTQQYGLQNQQMALAQLQNTQKYGLDTRGMTVQEQAQAAQAAYQQGQLGQGTRSLDLQQAQQAQQAQQFQQSLKQQQEAAYLQAYGHNQKPNTRWMKAT